MPKKKWTDEERKAFGQKMQEARQNKKELPTKVGDTEDLLQIIKEMQQRQDLLQAALLGKQEGLKVGDSVEGTREKYDTDPSKYPDYTDRLKQESRLTRFGFGENYRLMYEVKVSRYQRSDGIWEQQPRFIYQLWGRRTNPETGEYVSKTDPKTGQVMESIYGINQYIFHEDPEAFMQIAREEGINATDDNIDALLAEARYIQVLNWLLGCFYPEAAKPAENRTEMVIGNKLVEVKEVAVTEGEKVRFDFNGMKKL